jgi:TPR repeat protein
VQVEAGESIAQNNLGSMYANGDGVPENDAEAVRWYRMAAEQGLATAQNNLGVMYNNGEGVAQNFARAYLWLNLAAAGSQGDDRALFVEHRDGAAANLSPADRAAAQRLATQCQASGFKDCGESE